MYSQLKQKEAKKNTIQRIVHPGGNPPQWLRGQINQTYNNDNYWYNDINNFANGQVANINANDLYNNTPNPQNYRGRGYLVDPVQNISHPVSDSGEITNTRHRNSDRGHMLARQNGGSANVNNMFRQDPSTNRGLNNGDARWRQAEINFRNALANNNNNTHALWLFEYDNNRNVND